MTFLLDNLKNAYKNLYFEATDAYSAYQDNKINCKDQKLTKEQLQKQVSTDWKAAGVVLKILGGIVLVQSSYGLWSAVVAPATAKYGIVPILFGMVIGYDCSMLGDAVYKYAKNEGVSFWQYLKAFWNTTKNNSFEAACEMNVGDVLLRKTLLFKYLWYMMVHHKEDERPENPPKKI